MSSSGFSHTTRRIQHTKLPCYVFPDGAEMARHVAQIIASVIRERNALGQNAVLGLPTGSTPVDVYSELIRLHQQEGLDFSGVVTFNLDEYYGLEPNQIQSYHHWMNEHLFNSINIPSEHVHIPDGTVAPENVSTHCHQYEDQIKRAGGIDIVLLGIGRNGHIGFNEPISERESRTRLCILDASTRRSAASDFFGEEHVPTHAISMGVGTIMDARKVLLMALGDHKSSIIRETVEGDVDERIPASFLQKHHDATVLMDMAAAQDLKAVSTPWLTGNVEWNDALIKRAVLWLSETTGKALLKLDDEDFCNHSLHRLLRLQGPGQQLAHRVFRWMMDTIDYHPAGKDPKSVICFSPHPDDDVISMGGTLIRLVEDQHQVHIAYMTSGNIAVFDHDAMRIADLVTEYNRLFEVDEEKSKAVESSVLESFASKYPGRPDILAVRKIKGLIRWSEAKSGAAMVGCKEENLHFLDLPFYRTGTVAKNPVGDEDVAIIRELIEKVQPRQIYVAGDLSDPHGTHRVCAMVIFRALQEIEAANGNSPDVLLYRGAWQEYDLDDIQIAVPLSPHDLERKRKAIFMHESQKDEAQFPGSDPREFWQRAEDRNKGTADLYNRIGLPEYYALEAFVRWDGVPI